MKLQLHSSHNLSKCNTQLFLQKTSRSSYISNCFKKSWPNGVKCTTHSCRQEMRLKVMHLATIPKDILCR